MVKQPDMDPTAAEAERIGLPPRYFLYTIQQVQDILAIAPRNAKRLIWHEGKDTGPVDEHKILARNIAPPEAHQPMWRVAEPELVRWMRLKGFRVYQRGWVRQ